MNCPFCRGASKVVDSRPIPDGIRRRRECLRCERRFTTHERIVPTELRVVKAGDRAPEDFQPEKIAAVLRKVTKGRPVSEPQIEDAVRRIEADFAANGQTSVQSSELARVVADLLLELDQVAHFRFLSNYTDASGRVSFEREESPRPRRPPSTEQMDLF
jgi:transcriptional repressor NrdR